MTQTRLQTLGRRLRTPPRFLGRWRQRRALGAFARDGSPEACRLLAETAATTADEDLRARALEALGALSAPAQLDALCGVWAATRHPALARLLAASRAIALTPARVRALTALKLGELALLEDAPPGLVPPMIEACADPDPEIAARARACLARLRPSSSIDVLCLKWASDRGSLLAGIVREGNYVAGHPPHARVFSALLTGQSALLEDSGPEIVEPLLAAAEDADASMAQAARAALERLRQPEAREALCRTVLAQDRPAAREAALRAGLAPQAPQDRALFLFLTDQWPRYEALDFDGSLLREAYRAADRRLRARLAEKARWAGRTDWVSVVAASRQDRQLNALTGDEWATALEVLGESGRSSDLWRLAQAAPVVWSALILERLLAVSWRPEPAEQRAGFDSLAALARACCGERAPGQAVGARATRFLASLAGQGPFTRLQQRLEGHTGPVSCLAGAGDGGRLVSAGNDGTVRLWESSGAAQVLGNHDDWVSCLAASPDRRLAATGSRDRTLRLWDLAGGKPAGVLRGHTEAVREVRFTPDGRYVASGADDRTVRLWRMPDGQPAAVLEGHLDVVNCLAVSPDGRVLATGSYDQNVRLWSLPAGEPLATLTGHKALVNALSFAPSSQLLATGSKDRSVLLWGLPQCRQLTRLKAHKDDVTCLAIHPQGELLASGSWDSTVRLWALPGGEPVDVLGSTGTMDGHTGWVTCLAFSPDGGVLASGSVDNTVQLWAVPGGRALKRLAAHQDRIGALEFSAQGQTLLTGSWDGTAGVWQSELHRLGRLPVGETTLDDLDWAEDTLGGAGLEPAARAWIEFLVALMRWQRRHDIQLEERAPIAAGEFDIEIEG